MQNNPNIPKPETWEQFFERLRLNRFKTIQQTTSPEEREALIAIHNSVEAIERFLKMAIPSSLSFHVSATSYPEEENIL